MLHFVRALLFYFGICLSSTSYAQGVFELNNQRLPGDPSDPQSQQARPGGAETAPSPTSAQPAAAPLPTVPGLFSRIPTTPGGQTPGNLQPRLDRPDGEQIRKDFRTEPRNEFQEFVLQSTGRELPMFGHDLFKSSPSSFAPVDNVPVTADYVIGPGDEILIRAWGQIDVDFSAVVDRNGAISIPKVGVFNVAGIKYQDLGAYIKSGFGRVFRNFELTATLGRLRSIRIFVVGQAKRPGSYTVSSLSTLVTALFSVGGPSSTGSLRSIQLKRGNRVVSELDLYELLLSGDKSKDIQLMPGDVIYIPPLGPLVAVSGSVNVPAIYELQKDSPLSDVLRWAGGLSTTAQGQKATVERIYNRSTRKVEEFSLDGKGLSVNLRDGDLVTVFSVLPRFDNAVTLRGNVAQPGRFPWRSGMRVRDLIPKKEAVTSREFWQKRNESVGLDKDVSRLLRMQDSSSTQLEIGDLTERKVKEDDDLTIAATVRRKQIESDAMRFIPSPTKPVQPKDPNSDPQRLLNQIRPSVKEVNWDYAVIERISSRDFSTILVPFNLGKAVLEGDPQQNIELQPGDIITIFSKEDLQVSAARQTKFVRIEGEFNSPGVYQIQPGETLRQLIVRVGGFAPSAYVFGSEFTRESARKTQNVQYQEAVNRIERDLEADSAMRAKSSPEDAAGLPVLRETRKAQIARLRELKPTGRIVLEIPPNPTLADMPDLPLEDGDRLFVPQPSSMVSVFGSVFAETSFLYRPEKKVSDYIAQAGGPTVRADTSQIFILRADGSVAGSSRSLLSSSLANANVLRGDTIIVPEDYERVPLMRTLKDWGQVLYQFGLGAAALRVLKQ